MSSHEIGGHFFVQFVMVFDLIHFYSHFMVDRKE